MLQIEMINNNELIRHYSDINNYIKQVETDNVYIEAIDVVPCKYTYIETDIVIELDKTKEDNDINK